MYSLPLHPIVIHLPIVLAFLVPIIVAGILIGQRMGWLTHRSSWVAVAAGAVLVTGSVTAVRTGEAEEERVEDVVTEAAMERHEEAGEILMWGSILLLAALVPLPFVQSRRLAEGLGVVALAGALATSFLAFRAGHSGGELVYRYGAARAFVENVASAEQLQTPERRSRDEEHDH